MCGSDDAIRSTIAAMTVKEMKEFLKNESVPYEDCLDKSDLQARVFETMQKKHAAADAQGALK